MQTESTPASGNSSMTKTIVMVVLVLALLGVAFWGFKTNSTLKTTQGDLAAARTEIDGLKKDKADLTANLAQTTTDLESTKASLEKITAELATASASLTKTTGEKSALQAKITKASKLVDVLIGLNDNTVSFSEFLVLIKATNDSELLRLWNSFVASNTQANFNAFYNYLLGEIGDSLR